MNIFLFYYILFFQLIFKWYTRYRYIKNYKCNIGIIKKLQLQFNQSFIKFVVSISCAHVCLYGLDIEIALDLQCCRMKILVYKYQFLTF